MTCAMELLSPADAPCALGLAARIHERVVPRLAAVGLVLGAEGELSDGLRCRCSEELAAGLMELRAALLESCPQDEVRSLESEIRHWREQGVPLRLTRGADVLVPTELQALVGHVLNEAVTNALRHSAPVAVRVGVTCESGTLTMSILSDGPLRPQEAGRVGLGVGLKLAAAAAARHGGKLEWGAMEEEQWQVRLTVPIPSR
jgi:signal transduction histidine kinase